MLFVSTAKSVDIQNNNVYRVRNVNYGRYLSSAATGAVTAPSADTDLKQQWLLISAGNGGYYFRNVASGAYLKSARSLYTQWEVIFTTEPNASELAISVTDQGDNKVMRATTFNSGSGYAHNDAGNAIVCWDPSGPASQWIFEHVEKTAEELDAIYRNFTDIADEIAKNSTYQAHLSQLFDDDACTVLKDKDNWATNEHYLALPPALKTMVEKVAAGNWAETEGNWDSEHAEKYRVQLYEPYSEGSAAAGMAGIQAYTNMNNPTGILGRENELMYVMVDSDIPEGATLYFSPAPDEGMYNSVTVGTRLQKGLNTVLCGADNSHYFVYYTVSTVKDNKPYKNLKDYEPVKIHIEGGKLNGFFNYVGDKLYKPDTREDFDYTSKRASHIMYDLIGKYVILHFHLKDGPSKPGGSDVAFGVLSSLDPTRNPGNNKKHDPVEIMKDWDEMCRAERMLMGLQSVEEMADFHDGAYYESIVGDGHTSLGYSTDPCFHYSDYFNNRMMGISMQGDLYMNATSWRTAYNVNTISYVLTDFYEDGLWGPAHEYGHMNQPPINLAGTTEVSNNIFSNVALFFSDRATTSRTDYISDQLREFYEGKTFIQYGAFSNTRMFWQLWCYYHGTGHNKKFYPRLYELLRKNPIRKQGVPAVHNPKNDLLHFAKMCCIAAEEDLTDFFTAWGFFVPLEHLRVDDYTLYDMTLTQEDIDEVKQQIKDMGFEENRAILLIDDRVGSDKPSEGGHPKEKAGELGGFDDFINGKTASGSFSFNMDGNNVSVQTDGEDGVGFLIYDEEGNLIGFSNSHNFEVSDEVREKLMDGSASLQAIGTDNQTVEAVNTIRDGSVEEKIAMLKDVIVRCDALLDYVDPTETKVGYFFEKSCGRLQQLRDEAQAMVEAADESADFTGMWMDLASECNTVEADESARIPVVEGDTYVLRNFGYTDRILADNGKTCTALQHTAGNPVGFEAQWIFTPLDGKNEYEVSNMADGLYINMPPNMSATVTVGETPQSFTLVAMDASGIGVFALEAGGVTSAGIHVDGSRNVVRWHTSSNPTQWTITKVNTAEYVQLRKDIAELLEKSADLLDKAGETQETPAAKMNLTEDRFHTNAPYTASDNGDMFKSWSVIIDGDTQTYFHSDYSGKNSNDGLDHYIQIQAPEGEEFNYFNVWYITRNSTGSAAKISAFTIWGSPDGEAWTQLRKVNSGLNTAPLSTNSSGEIEAPEGTKYIRFMVNTTGQSAGGHSFFALAELWVDNRTGEVICVPDTKYPYVLSEDMSSLVYSSRAADSGVADPTSSLETLKQHLERLQDDYMNLSDKMDFSTGIYNPYDSSQQDEEYFTIEGFKVTAPSHGLYIRKRGNKSEKIIIR